MKNSIQKKWQTWLRSKCSTTGIKKGNFNPSHFFHEQSDPCFNLIALFEAMLCREKLGKVSLAKELSFDWPYLGISFCFPWLKLWLWQWNCVKPAAVPGKGFNFYPGETSGTVQTGNLNFCFAFFWVDSAHCS